MKIGAKVEVFSISQKKWRRFFVHFLQARAWSASLCGKKKGGCGGFRTLFGPYIFRGRTRMVCPHRVPVLRVIFLKQVFAWRVADCCRWQCAGGERRRAVRFGNTKSAPFVSCPALLHDKSFKIQRFSFFFFFVIDKNGIHLRQNSKKNSFRKGWHRHEKWRMRVCVRNCACAFFKKEL